MKDPIDKILKEIDSLKREVTDIGVRLDVLKKDLLSEMNLKHQEIYYRHKDHEKRISDTEKWKNWLAIAIFGAVLMTGLKVIGL